MVEAQRPHVPTAESLSRQRQNREMGIFCTKPVSSFLFQLPFVFCRDRLNNMNVGVSFMFRHAEWPCGADCFNVYIHNIPLSDCLTNTSKILVKANRCTYSNAYMTKQKSSTPNERRLLSFVWIIWYISYHMDIYRILIGWLSSMNMLWPPCGSLSCDPHRVHTRIAVEVYLPRQIQCLLPKCSPH